MRKKWVIALVVIVAITGVVIAVPFFVNVNRYRGTIEARLSQAINRKVALSDLRLSLFPVALESRDVHISDDPAFRNGDFVSVDTFRIRVNFWPLLKRQIQVTSLELISPRVWLVSSRGAWNFSTLGKSVDKPEMPAQDSSGSAGVGINSFDIYKFTLKNGRLTVVDQARPSEAQSYDIVEFTARDISTASRVPFALVLGLPNEKEPVRLEGTAGPLNLANLAASPAEGNVTARSFHVGQIAIENVKGTFIVHEGNFIMKPLDFDVCSGHQTGSIALNFLQPQPALELKTSLTGVDVNAFLSNTGSTKNMIYGLLNGAVSIRTSGDTQQQVLRNLTGEAALNLQKGKLAHISIGRQVAAVAQVAGISFPEGDTPITRMEGHIQMGDNSARTNDLRIQTPDLELMCQGYFTFDGDLNLNVLGTFSKEASQRIQSGSPVGGLLNAVFQGQNQQVTVPLQVTGNFQAPRFKLDTKKVLSMRISSDQPGKPALQNTIRAIQDLFKRKKP